MYHTPFQNQKQVDFRAGFCAYFLPPLTKKQFFIIVVFVEIYFLNLLEKKKGESFNVQRNKN